MSNADVWLFLVLVAFVPSVEGFGCPTHCFCYMWRELARTDCVNRNMFNTFVGFSHQTQILDLSHNVISILHGNEFLDANLKYLQDLRLSNNKIHKIDKFSFNGLELLQNLDLSFNSIEYLNPTTFKYNHNLKTLNVSFNPLSIKKNEPFLSDATPLQILDMTSCRLEFVTLRLFSDLTRLKVLNVSQNYIRTIEPEFLKEMKNLKYLDVSKNILPCNDETKVLLRVLEEFKIQFQNFCQRSQKIINRPAIDTEEKNNLKMELYQGDNEKNKTKQNIQEKTIFDNILQFFRSIPPFYAIVFGIQVGVFIGSFSTYFCLKKSFESQSQNANQDRTAEEITTEESENLTFALIPLHTPPGTPPSPYHSRFFSSNFSLSFT